VLIVYTFNKQGFEAENWEREIRGVSQSAFKFIPFNHHSYMNPHLYSDAVKLDRLYQARDPRLMQLYRDFEAIVRDHRPDCVVVSCYSPFHPDYLRRFRFYKVLYSGDDPGATYMRNVPYLHAYQHVMFVSPCYSADMDLEEKMRYSGVANADWVPISVFDFEFDTTKNEDTILPGDRNIDIIYVGSFFRQKLDLLARVKRAFGRRVKIHGFFRIKHNLFFVVRHGYPGWVSQISMQERVRLYQRSKIGFNIHWNEFGLGNQRLFHLPANGVMQICDCPAHLDRVFRVGKEVEAYGSPDELIDKLRYYLDHDTERIDIARAGYTRTMAEYRFAPLTRRIGTLIEAGMARIGW